eukprot:c45648_g1_i1.p1 GENE.c45648_g1_i1~~c45648_g1_i1.p1  ORF type:complete len:371 (-),score=90.73 c45648_g1_i1:206-1198(-)
MSQRKILLLGSGQSGKSTIFKQVQLLYANKFKTKEERLAHLGGIHGNIVQGIKMLVGAAEKHGLHVEHSLSNFAREVLEMPFGTVVTPDLARSIRDLWQDPAIKRAFEHRDKFQIGDYVAYFLDQLDVIGQPNYVPSVQDIIMSRVRTTGITEQEAHIQKASFRFVDVGGQRGERKKWIHCFDKSDIVMFVTAISEYNQVLEEDNSTNRLLESINLFKQVATHPNFSRVHFVLFLNKRDLFDQKFPKSHADLRQVFPEYDGGPDVDKAHEFIQRYWYAMWFEMWPQERDPELCRLVIHWTNATDSNIMQLTISAVTDKVIRDNLRLNGMM